MTASILISAWVPALGASLIQFLWQAALVALVVLVVQPWLRRRTANVRYLSFSLALLALPVLFAVDLARYASGAAGASTFTAAAAPLLQQAAPWMVGAWVAGMGLSGVYAGCGWMWAQRLRRAARQGAAAALPLAWREQCEELRLCLRIGARVHLALSGRVSGPCTLGWWRPVVLLPLSALTALPPEQVTALLAHELAHIRRHDYLVNLFQRGLEVVFFFHPAVWWLSHQMSDVREICCDDLAVAACGGDRAAYARALVELAELAAPGRAVASIPASALAATGGALGERVRCLLGSGPGAASRRGLWRASVAMVMVAATGLCLLSASGQSIAAPPVPAAPQAPVLLPSPQATAPSVARSAKEGTLAPLRQAAAPSPRPLPLPHRLPLPRPVPPRPLPPAPPHPPAPSAATTVMQGATRPLPPPQPLPPAPPLPPPGLPAGRTSVVAFTLTGFQACVPEIAWVPQILPSGQMVLRVETLVRCFPLVNPTEVLVISTI